MVQTIGPLRGWLQGVRERGKSEIAPKFGAWGTRSESCSVVSDSLQPHGIVHGIFQARILEWGAFPFSRGSSLPRDRTQVSRIAGRFFTNWAIRETPLPPTSRSLQQMCWPELYSRTNPNPNFSNACPQCNISFIHSYLASFQSPALTSAHP